MDALGDFGFWILDFRTRSRVVPGSAIQNPKSKIQNQNRDPHE